MNTRFFLADALNFGAPVIWRWILAWSIGSFAAANSLSAARYSLMYFLTVFLAKSVSAAILRIDKPFL